MTASPMQIQTDMQASHERFNRRFENIARFGAFDAILPKRNGSIVFVGGPRNRRGSLPAQTKAAITAVFRTTLRMQRELERVVRELR